MNRNNDNDLAEALKVRDELRTALGDAGMTLPSLAVDLIAYVRETPLPLLELGRCDLATARLLTKALRGWAR
ncbi:hypothetical protein AB0J38_13535 [Streptomyces sp. NPDC050095]|uniref:hypothetical protein n=1 Tax=unclassified Streptomyces TaxID=2593676 RepID=UPI00344625C9